MDLVYGMWIKRTVGSPWTEYRTMAAARRRVADSTPSSPNLTMIMPKARGPHGESVPRSSEHKTHRIGSAVAMVASSSPMHGA
jgi:hypothetical protein